MNQKYLVVKNRFNVSKVEVKDIMYILRDGRKLIVVTEDNEYVYYSKMKNIEPIVGDSLFRLLDRCFINLNYLKTVNLLNRRCIFVNGDELFWGRDSISKLRKAFDKYLFENGLTDNLDETIGEEWEGDWKVAETEKGLDIKKSK